MRKLLIQFITFKNPGIEYFRLLLLLIGVACGIGCATLSQEVVREVYGALPTIETGLNGGAIGLGIISGMCFLGAAITFLKKD